MSAMPELDVTKAMTIRDAPPARSLICLILLLSIKDHATEVRFEPGVASETPCEDPDGGDCRLSYMVEGTRYEMVTPPAHLAPELAKHVRTIARIDGLWGLLSAWTRKLIGKKQTVEQVGQFIVKLGDHRVQVQAVLMPSPHGDIIVLNIDRLSDQAIRPMARQVLEEFRQTSTCRE